ncbi:hypothetical protein A9R04_14825 [Nocardiopsis dassonvillei]|nr:hypothetical protein A9R04_14825 [Nocardiopsis dassonvillei]
MDRQAAGGVSGLVVAVQAVGVQTVGDLAGHRLELVDRQRGPLRLGGHQSRFEPLPILHLVGEMLGVAGLDGLVGGLGDRDRLTQSQSALLHRFHRGGQRLLLHVLGQTSQILGLSGGNLAAMGNPLVQRAVAAVTGHLTARVQTRHPRQRPVPDLVQLRPQRRDLLSDGLIGPGRHFGVQRLVDDLARTGQRGHGRGTFPGGRLGRCDRHLHASYYRPVVAISPLFTVRI